MLKVMRQFVGFSVLHLELEPTMALVMDPMVVAKYWGFHVSKGTSVSTIKKDMSYISQVPFYMYNQVIPNITKISRGDTKEVMAWYNNLLTQLTSQVKALNKSTIPITISKAITLYEIWECTKKEIDEHLEELEVRVMVMWTSHGVWGCASPTHPSQFTPPPQCI